MQELETTLRTHVAVLGLVILDYPGQVPEDPVQRSHHQVQPAQAVQVLGQALPGMRALNGVWNGSLPYVQMRACTDVCVRMGVYTVHREKRTWWWR